ncbi:MULTISPECIES: GntR family transcriptional regulator [Fusobacterium]|uniref:GntR family transcriptional regulator n=1 Tax=Fusobacterium TaxID=848 RepID=UPI0019800BFF|nr:MULTISPECIES: GntR family transcriptional regulator [Fusobacterium]
MQKRTNISDNIYLQLKEQFMTGEFEFGEKIVELELCEKLNVSRTPLREAIKKLEIEGIIERTPNGRIKIMDMNEERIEEIFDIRMALEDIIFDRLFSLDSTKNLILELENNLNLTKFYFEISNVDEIKKLFSNFNRILYKYCKLDFTIKTLKTYIFILEKFRLSPFESEIRLKEAHLEHVEIVNCIKNNELEIAKKINRIHLSKVKESIIQYFKDKNDM